MTRGALFAGLVTVLGCIPEPSLPKCSVHDDCWRVGGGFCSCQQGYCFKFACEEPPSWLNDVGDTPDATTADTPDVEAAACPPNANPADKPACVLAEEALGLTGDPLRPAVAADGRVAVVHVTDGQGSLAIFDPQLSLLFDLPLGSTASTGRPVFVGGDVLASTAAGVRRLAEHADTLDTAVSGAAASSPVPYKGGLAVALSDGRVNTLGTPSSEPLLPPSDAYEIALRGDVLAAISAEGEMRLVDLVKNTPLLSKSGCAGAPAWLGAGGFVFVQSNDTLGGGANIGGTWTLLPSTEVGASPASPVVGGDNIVFVASRAAKQLVAIRVDGATPVPRWTLSPLPDAASDAPLVLGDGRLLIPLLSGGLTLTSDALGTNAPDIEWTWNAQTAPQLHPRTAGPGRAFSLTSSGQAAVFVVPDGNIQHAWPTLD